MSFAPSRPVTPAAVLFQVLTQAPVGPLPVPPPLSNVQQSAASAMQGGMRWRLALALCLVTMLIGVFAGFSLEKVFRRRDKRSGMPQWPKDWPKPQFTRNEQDAGYMDLKPEDAMNARAMPFGRTYPRLRLLPNVFPLRGLRRRIEYATSRAVYVPYKKRFQHTAILGGTGKGKSTSFVYPALAYGAMEPDTAYFAIDVKSPQFLRTFGPLYQKANKPVYFVDPWTPNETMAFEPVWRASGERKKIVAEVVTSYSLDPSPPQNSGNSEFFNLAASRLMRSLLDIAQFWPRRFCNLPCIAQLVGGGGNAIKEAIENLHTLVPDFEQELRPAMERVLAATAADLRPLGRRAELTEALEVLDRAGYDLAARLRQARRDIHGDPKAKDRAVKTGEALEAIRRDFWIDAERLSRSRQDQLKRIVKSCGEFIQMPDDTRNSVVSTVQNKVEWFADREIARVFSRDEMDPSFLVQRPCLMLVGSPMAKLQVGSLFVSAIITNLALNAIFERGQYLENRELGTKVSKHGVFFMLDEFPQLGVKEAPKILATFRSFLGGLMMIYQDRGQLKQLYGENVSTVESNTIHAAVLSGCHPEAAEFYVSKMLGKANIRKENISKTEGESKKNISIQDESKDLMGSNDFIYMKLNGTARPDMAMNMSKDVEPYPMKPLPFYEDPVCHKLLNMERTLVRTDDSGRPTWKFWMWKEQYDFARTKPRPLLVRRYPLPEADRRAGKEDLVWDRLQDPYTQYLDFVVPELRTGWDELYVPDLDFASISVFENNPDPTARTPAPVPGAPAAPMAGAFPGAGGAFAPGVASAPPPPPVPLVPLYSKDVRTLMNDDFQPMEAVSDHAIVGATLTERLEAEDAALDADASAEFDGLDDTNDEEL